MILIEQVLRDLTVQTIQGHGNTDKHCSDHQHSHNSQLLIRNRLAQKSMRSGMVNV